MRGCRVAGWDSVEFLTWRRQLAVEVKCSVLEFRVDGRIVTPPLLPKAVKTRHRWTSRAVSAGRRSRVWQWMSGWRGRLSSVPHFTSCQPLWQSVFLNVYRTSWARHAIPDVTPLWYSGMSLCASSASTWRWLSIRENACWVLWQKAAFSREFCSLTQRGCKLIVSPRA